MIPCTFKVFFLRRIYGSFISFRLHVTFDFFKGTLSSLLYADPQQNLFSLICSMLCNISFRFACACMVGCNLGGGGGGQWEYCVIHGLRDPSGTLGMCLSGRHHEKGVQANLVTRLTCISEVIFNILLAYLDGDT